MRIYICSRIALMKRKSSEQGKKTRNNTHTRKRTFQTYFFFVNSIEEKGKKSILSCCRIFVIEHKLITMDNSFILKILAYHIRFSE